MNRRSVQLMLAVSMIGAAVASLPADAQDNDGGLRVSCRG